MLEVRQALRRVKRPHAGRVRPEWGLGCQEAGACPIGRQAAWLPKGHGIATTRVGLQRRKVGWGKWQCGVYVLSGARGAQGARRTADGQCRWSITMTADGGRHEGMREPTSMRATACLAALVAVQSRAHHVCAGRSMGGSSRDGSARAALCGGEQARGWAKIARLVRLGACTRGCAGGDDSMAAVQGWRAPVMG